jgi:hypothetical protein
MPTNQHNDRSALDSLGTQELRTRVVNGLLPPDAHAVALQLLKSRGAYVDDLPATPPDLQAEPKPKGFLASCMTGKAPLWKAFWLLGLALAIPMSVLELLTRGNPIIALLIGVVSQATWTVAVWRCAFRTSSWVWGILARGWVALLWLVIILAVLRGAGGA